jgi:hypothetical protein
MFVCIRCWMRCAFIQKKKFGIRPKYNSIWEKAYSINFHLKAWNSFDWCKIEWAINEFKK